MKKLDILVDLDGVAADLLPLLLRRYNEAHWTQFSVDHITDWDLTKALPNGHHVFDYMTEPGFFRTLEPIPGAVEVLKRLSSQGHKIHVLSTPFVSLYRPARNGLHINSTCAEDKLEWVQEHLPFIGAKNTMLVRHKEMVKGDVLIDDKPSTLIKYRQAWSDSFLASIEYPYNGTAKAVVDVMAPSHKTFRDAWFQIGTAIEMVASRPS